MKSFFLFLSGLLIVISACTNQPSTGIDNSQLDPSPENQASFNEQLAIELQADDYGMKSYVMAFLKEGPKRDQDSATVTQLQRAHMDNIIRMADEGLLILAGPFLDKGELRGIYIFNVKTVEEAKELTNSDPAIQAGRLEMELHPWYGSAALMKVNEIHQKISKVAI